MMMMVMMMMMMMMMMCKLDADFTLIYINFSFCYSPKGRFTQYNFLACYMLTMRLGHESFHVNKTYNLLAIVMHDTKNVVGFRNMFLYPMTIVATGNHIVKKQRVL